MIFNPVVVGGSSKKTYSISFDPSLFSVQSEAQAGEYVNFTFLGRPGGVIGIYGESQTYIDPYYVDAKHMWFVMPNENVSLTVSG